MTSRSRKRDQKQSAGNNLGNSDMSDMEKFALLLEQRDKIQAEARKANEAAQQEAQKRLIQVQTDSTQNLADVANSLAKVHGAQQDAHDVLGAVEKAIVEHDNALRRHIDAMKQRNKEQDRERDRLETTVVAGCTGCQDTQKTSSLAIIEVMGKVESAIKDQTAATNKLVEKQVSLGKILGSIITVSGALAVLIGAILAMIKLFSSTPPS